MQKAFQNVELTPRPLLEFSEIYFAMIATLAQYVIYAVTQWALAVDSVSIHFDCQL